MADGGFDFKELETVLTEVKTGFEAFKEAHAEELKELATKGSVDALITEKLEKINTDLNEKQERLDKFEASLKRKSAKVVDENGNEVDLDAKSFDWANTIARSRGKRVETFTNSDMEAYKAAFDSFVRNGEKQLDGIEEKALSVGSDPDGGYVVHPDMNGRIVKKIFETSPVRQYASTQVISTDSLEGLHDLDEAGCGWVEETGARLETDTPQLNKWRIPVHEVWAFPKATQKLLDDSAIDMEAWLSAKVSEKFSRVENAAFVNGTGVSQPRGFLTYGDWTSAGTYTHGAIEQFDTGANGAFAATPNGADVLLDAIYGLKAPYRANAVFAMNRMTAKMTRKLKDSDGSYLWQPGIQLGQPSTLLGYAVASFEDMPDGTTTGALGIAFGDFRSAYQIVDRMGIRVLRDPYTAKPYVGLYSTKRVGGDVVDFEAIKLIKFA